MSDQALEALKTGNEKRIARAQLKRRVGRGELPVSTVLILSPEILRSRPFAKQRVTIADVLAWQPRWGRARAERKLEDFGINPDLELHAISKLKREWLAKSLR